MDSKNLFYRDLYKSHVKIVKGEGVYLFEEEGYKDDFILAMDAAATPCTMRKQENTDIRGRKFHANS